MFYYVLWVANKQRLWTIDLNSHQKDDDGVEDEPGKEKASFPETKAAKGQNVGGQGQRCKNADKDSWKKNCYKFLISMI